MVLVSKQNRRAVYTQLFNDGVIVVEKNFAKKEHQDCKGVSNLEVLMLTKSLASRNFVSGKFSWGWNYYTLNDQGIEYLREQLGLPAAAVPNTMSKQARPVKETEAGRPERPSKWANRNQE